MRRHFFGPRKLPTGGRFSIDKLILPTNITLLWLPPKPPVFNSVENLWQLIPQNRLSSHLDSLYLFLVNGRIEMDDDPVDPCVYLRDTLQAIAEAKGASEA